MRIAEAASASALNPENALKDMQTLYGGTTERHSGILSRQPEHHFTSPDGHVRAYTQGARRTPESGIAISNLHLPVNAARWTALQAYLVKSGKTFSVLQTEVPGLRGHQEWTNRRALAQQTTAQAIESQYTADLEPFISDATLSEIDYERQRKALEKRRDLARQSLLRTLENPKFFTGTSLGAGNDPLDRFRETSGEILGRMVGSVNTIAETADAATAHRAEDDYLQLLAKADALPLSLSSARPVDTHTVFYARGTDLSSAAHTMADHYSELMFHSDDPNQAVALALGASNLDIIDNVWAEAMATDTPLAAGQIVLRSLISAA
ncbi:MAG: hypothetical protein ACQR33_05765 [Candidatus Saccharibacteria bacterium]